MPKLNKLTASLSLLTTGRTLVIAGALALGLTSHQATAASGAEIDIIELARYANIDSVLLDRAITQATYQQKIIDAMNRPYEGKPWYMYRKLFITDKRIKGGVDFYLAHEQELLRAQNELGVAPEVICAIIGVETFYGQNMGTWKVLDALYTLGFHYPKRASYFSKEFANYVKLAARTPVPWAWVSSCHRPTSISRSTLMAINTSTSSPIAPMPWAQWPITSRATVGS